MDLNVKVHVTPLSPLEAVSLGLDLVSRTAEFRLVRGRVH